MSDWSAFDTDPLSARLAEESAGWRPTPRPEVPTMLGVDVSNHQGLIDWRALARSGRRFAFMKASEDATYVDRWFAGPLGHNWREAKAAGLARGAYHFARPSELGPAQSVTHFENRIKAAGGLEAGDLIALDMEDERVPANVDLSQWCAEWLDLAERVFGVRPVFYSGHWYMQPHGLLIAELGKYPLWYASYQDALPPVPKGWPRIAFWQFTAHGRVPGITGDADENRFYGTAAELHALGKQAPAPTADRAAWEDRVLSPLYRAYTSIPGMTGVLPEDEADGRRVFEAMVAIKQRHGWN